MADIKHAAMWLQQGKDVIRRESTWWLTPYYPNKRTFAIVDGNGKDRELTTTDLLADDWVIANESQMGKDAK